MITLKLDDKEAVILHNIIASFMEELRVEIMHTDRREYREMLKQQETIVRKILEDLETKGVEIPA